MLLGQMAKHAGAGRITGVVSSAAKVAAAARHGFDDVLLAADVESGAIAGGSFDLVLEAVGSPAREAAGGRRRRSGGSCSTATPESSGDGTHSRVAARRQRPRRRMEHHDPRGDRHALLRSISVDAFALVAGGAVTLDVRHVFALRDAAAAHRLGV